MQIDRAIFNKYLHEAAVEQFATEYEAKGTRSSGTLTQEASPWTCSPGRATDVRAVKFKVNDPKHREPGYAQRWMEHVRGRLGKGEFHLIYVPYPTITEVDAPELETALPRWVQDRKADDLDAVLPGPKHVWLKRLVLDRVHVEHAVTVAGQAVLGLAPVGDGGVSMEEQRRRRSPSPWSRTPTSPPSAKARPSASLWRTRAA